jgi:hypothetical protein
MMETASISESSANFYQTTRRNNTEDSHLHTRRRENLKSRYFCLGLSIIMASRFVCSALEVTRRVF